MYQDNAAKLLLLQSVQQLGPCQTEPLIHLLVPVQRNIEGITIFVEGMSDLEKATGMDISEQHWSQGADCTGEIFLASYSYYFFTENGLFLFIQLSKNILVMN